MWCWIIEHGELLAAIGTLCTAIFTCWIAVITRDVAKSAEKSSQAQILIKFMEEYRSEKMLDALTSLRKWKDDYPGSYGDYVFLLRTHMHKEINEARRLVKSYFFSALELYESTFANDLFMKTICEKQGIEILFDIVEPLEQSLWEFLNAVKKSATKADAYQYTKNLEPDFKRKFNALRELKKKFEV
jgi:hypothetical protein